MISLALRAAPIALLGLAEAWVASDLLALSLRWAAAFAVALFSSVILFGLTWRFRFRAAQWSALVILGGTYIAAHQVAAAVPFLPAVLFIGLLIAQAEARLLAERFAPVFVATLSDAQRKQVGNALARAVVRLAISVASAVLVPLLAAELAGAGLFPATSVPTALLLAVGLVAIVLVIALLPTLRRTTH